MTTPRRALFDTSILIALETGRTLDDNLIPDEMYVSVITIGELHAGVYAAKNTQARATRTRTLEYITALEPLTVDLAAAQQWGVLRALLKEAGLKVNVNDLWIAAIASANNLPILTQDTDFEHIQTVGGPQVIKV